MLKKKVFIVLLKRIIFEGMNSGLISLTNNRDEFLQMLSLETTMVGSHLLFSLWLCAMVSGIQGKTL